jgi:tetratricopeptide (TPR) repeat protein
MTQFLYSPSQVLVKFVLVILLIGCVTKQDSALIVTAHANELAKTDTAGDGNLPSIPLSSDLLYQILVGEIAGQRGELDLAGDIYLKLARSTRDPRLAERSAQIAVFTQDKTKALAALKLWVDIAPNNLEARQGLVAFLIRNGQADSALPHLEKILSSAPPVPPKAASGVPGSDLDDPPEQGFLAIAAMLSREVDKAAALKLMGKFVAAHADKPDALFAYSSLAISAGDLPLARSAVDKALQKKPNWINAIALRARILQLQGETDTALAYLGDAVRANPKDLPLRMNYARLLIDVSRFEDARTEFAAIAEQMPNSADLAFSLGLLSLQINQLDDGERYINRAVKLGKQDSETAYYLGQIAEAKKQYLSAITLYKTVGEGEAYLDAQLRVVALLAEQDDFIGARAHLQTIQVEGPQQAKLLIMAEADLLGEEKKYAQAMQIYDDALKELPQDNTLLYGRAMLAEKMDRLDVLEQDMLNILGREPDNARALNALGYTLADRTTRYDEALSYIKRALELNPQDAATLDSMGWVQYRLGNTQESLRFLQEAYRRDANAEIAAHLGEVLWVSGDREGARKAWAAALEFAPRDEVLQATMKRFEAR